jgi:uncharacterized protein
MNIDSEFKLQEILHFAAEHFFPAEEEVPSINVDTRSSDGDTPLHLFAWRSDLEAARVLIECRADVNAIGDMGQTPLHVALSQGSVELVILLLEAGAKIDIRSEFHETPHEAASRIGGRFAEIFTNRSSRRNAAREA